MHVANRRGDFVGHVAASPLGGFVVFDSQKAPLGRHETLEAAQAVLTGASPSRLRARRGRTTARMALQAALVAASAGLAVVAGEVLVTLA
jgi:hypothetical protein